MPLKSDIQVEVIRDRTRSHKVREQQSVPRGLKLAAESDKTISYRRY